MEFLFTKSEKEFDDAESFCNEKGGFLYEPRNETILDKVLNHTNHVGIGAFWLGVNDIGEEGSFVYACDETPITLKNWTTGEPNIFGNEEDCVNVFNGFWHDLPCHGYTMAIVCVKYKSGTDS